MTTPFASRDARLSRSIERAFGEQFTFAAKATAVNGDVNAPRIADGSKSPFTCAGVWEAESNTAYPHAQSNMPDDGFQRFAVQFPSVSVDKALLTWMPGTGTKVTRLFDGAVYEVAKALPDDMGRVLFILSKRMKP
jgi:hypothetical protein